MSLFAVCLVSTQYSKVYVWPPQHSVSSLFYVHDYGVDQGQIASSCVFTLTVYVNGQAQRLQKCLHSVYKKVFT